MLIGEIVKDKRFEKSDCEIETDESIEELNFPQEYNSNQSIVIILDDINRKEMKISRVQAIFKRSRQNNIYTFLKSQDY